MKFKVRCTVCGRLTAGRKPPGGDGTFWFPRRHKNAVGGNCPGNILEGKIVSENTPVKIDQACPFCREHRLAVITAAGGAKSVFCIDCGFMGPAAKTVAEAAERCRGFFCGPCRTCRWLVNAQKAVGTELVKYCLQLDIYRDVEGDFGCPLHETRQENTKEQP